MADETQTLEQEIELGKKRAKIREEIAIQSAKMELEQVEIRINREKESLQVQYEQGLLTIQDYLAKKGRLETENHNARVKELNEEFAAQIEFNRKDNELAVMTAKMKQAQATADFTTRKATLADEYETKLKALSTDTTKTPDEQLLIGKQLTTSYKARLKIYTDSYKASMAVASGELADIQAKDVLKYKEHTNALLKEDDRLQKEKGADALMHAKDEQAALRIRVRAEFADKKESLTEQRMQLEDSFKEGLASADDYLAARKKQIQDEHDLAINDAYDIYKNGEKTQKALAEFSLATIKADVQAQKERTKLSLSEDDIRLKASEQNFDRINKLYETQATVAKTPSGARLVGETEIVAIEKLNALHTARIEQLKTELKQYNPHKY